MISQAGKNLFICCWDDMNMIIDRAHKGAFIHTQKKLFLYKKTFLTCFCVIPRL